MPRTRVPRTRADIEARLRQLMSDEFGVRPEELAADAMIAQLGRDSVGTLELTMAVEDEFDVEIPDSALDRLHTFDDVASYLTERLDLAEAKTAE